MLFNGDMVKSDHLVILSYMVPRLSISGHYDVIWKKSNKYYLGVFFIFELFFSHEYKHVVISFVYASKWWYP